ncbi:MAG TPA: hypothetical protein VEI97_02330 [bacterium]|nr:hypothetical protein [bacterium]
MREERPVPAGRGGGKPPAGGGNGAAVAAGPDPEPVVQVVTPEMAADWLERSGSFRNRSKRPATIDRYARDMRAGKWAITNVIVIDDKGRVIDGQHRLEAVILAGVPVKMLVLRGVPTEAYTTIDQGMVRKISDLLAQKGVSGEDLGYVNPVILGGAARYLWGWENGRLREMLRGGRYWPTTQETLEVIDRHPDLLASVTMAQSNRMRRFRLMPSTIMAALHMMFRTKDPRLADEFFEQLGTGDGPMMAPGKPLRFLRDRLVQENATGRGRKGVNRYDLFALTVKTWNYLRTGGEPSKLQWRPAGQRPEAFPEPV